MMRLVSLLTLAFTLSAAAQDPEKPKSSTLLGRLVEAINAGRFTGKTEASDAGYRENGKKVAWTDLDSSELFSLLEGLGLKDEDLLTLADWAWRTGLKEDAQKVLWRFVSADRRARQVRAEETVARWRRVAVPEGGYAYHAEFGWESVAERAERESDAKLPGICKTLSLSGDARAIEKSFAALLGLYNTPGIEPKVREEIRTEALAALRTAKERRLKSMETRAKGAGGFKILQAMKTELNRRREEALKVIYDPKIYLPENHPDWRKGDKINGQARVDELVLKNHPGSVGELWESAGNVMARLDPSIQRDVETIQTINAKYFPQLGETAPEDDLKDYQQIVINLSARIDLKTFALDARDAELLAWNRRVDKYNEELAEAGVGKEEKEHAKVVNDYREMMGRRRVFLDARLCRATKKHSAACSAAGRIWHEGPDGTPQSRAQAEGYAGGVAENVAIGYGTPDDVWWRGWYRASDHHRNGLADRHNCMGYGYSGNVGTQNFSQAGVPSSLTK